MTSAAAELKLSQPTGSKEVTAVIQAEPRRGQKEEGQMPEDQGGARHGC